MYTPDHRPWRLSRMEFDAWFWEQLNHLPNGCWEWKKGKDYDGYGLTSFERKIIKAHRLAYLLKYGEIPQGMQVLHKCDNPPCCNPEHLMLGTTKDNMRDAHQKGRLAGRGRNFGMTKRRGELHPTATITNEQAKEIRARFLAGEKVADIGRAMGIGYHIAYSVAHGLSFQYI